MRDSCDVGVLCGVWFTFVQNVLPVASLMAVPVSFAVKDPMTHLLIVLLAYLKASKSPAYLTMS